MLVVAIGGAWVRGSASCEAVGARFDFYFLGALRPEVFSHLRTFVPPYPRKKTSVPPYLRISELHHKGTQNKNERPVFILVLTSFKTSFPRPKHPAEMRRLLSEKKGLRRKFWRLRRKIKWHFFGISLDLDNFELCSKIGCISENQRKMNFPLVFLSIYIIFARRKI